MNKEEIIKYIFDEENYSNFISSQNGGEQYYTLLEKEESKILKDYISNLQKKVDKQKEVLDKIKEKVNQYEFISGYYDYIEENGYAETTSHDTLKEDILELLEETE